MTSELFSSVYKEKSDHLFDDRIFSCPVPAFTHWSIFVPLSENPWNRDFFYSVTSKAATRLCSLAEPFMINWKTTAMTAIIMPKRIRILR